MYFSSLVQEAHREREAFRVPQLATRVGEGVHIVADFPDIVGGAGGGAALGAGLERQQIHERGLRSLDLRRHDGFLANERVDEPFDRGHHLAGQIEPAEFLLRGSQELVRLCI